MLNDETSVFGFQKILNQLLNNQVRLLKIIYYYISRKNPVGGELMNKYLFFYIQFTIVFNQILREFTEIFHNVIYIFKRYNS